MFQAALITLCCGYQKHLLFSLYFLMIMKNDKTPLGKVIKERLQVGIEIGQETFNLSIYLKGTEHVYEIFPALVRK